VVSEVANLVARPAAEIESDVQTLLRDLTQRGLLALADADPA